MQIYVKFRIIKTNSEKPDSKNFSSALRRSVAECEFFFLLETA